MSDRFDSAHATGEEIREALKQARQFIANGIELGFIRMPDPGTPDPAHGTLGLIDRALSSDVHPKQGVETCCTVRRERDALRIAHAAVAEDANEMDKALSMAWAVIGGAHDLTLAEEIMALMRRNSDKATALQRQEENVRAAFIAGRDSIHGVDPAYHEAAWEAYRRRIRYTPEVER